MLVCSSFLAPLRGRWFSVLGGLCFLTLGLIGLPKSADASCGDYLAHPQSPMMASHTPTDHRTDSPTPATPRPCRGPSCQRNDAPLPVPTPAPVRLLGERWATVTEFDVVLPAAATQFPPVTAEFCLPALPARLDRPPKIG